MPQVPYAPIPTVDPSYQPLGRDQVNPSAAAFGGATAQALGELGSAFSKDGDELFSRADAMQQLKNHSEANEAAANYSEQASKLHADFNALQGKDAVNGQDAYNTNLKELRKSMQDNLSNEQAQKIFENESFSILNRSIFNGAGHAAAENKAYSIGASAARVQAARNAALVDPTDEKAFNEHLATTIDNTRAQWGPGGKGADDDTVNNAVHKAVSDLWYDRIAGLANGPRPFTAEKLLAQLPKGTINGADLGQLTRIVRDATHTVGARNLANEVLSGSDLSWGAKPVSIAQAKLAIGTYESNNNYQSRGVNVPANADHPAGIALGKYQIMSYNLGPWLKEAGMNPMTPAEFLNSPSSQDRLFESKFGQLMQKNGSFNGAAGDWLGHGTKGDPLGTTIPKYLAATNGILARNASLTDKVTAVRTAADKFSPNDPLMADYAEHTMIASHNQTIAAKRDDDYRNRQTVEGALIGGSQQDGKIPTTVDELKAAGPQVEAAWQKMPDSDKRRYMGIMAQNAKGNVAMTEDRLREYQRLKGLSYSDTAAFLDSDVIGADLPMSARKELVNLQQQKLQNADQDPRINHALNILKPTLDSAQIVRKNDPQAYDQFVGGLDQAIKIFQQDNKAPPKEKDIQEMGQRLIQTQALSKGWFGMDTKAPLYNVIVPDRIKTKIIDNYKADNGIEPTDDMVQRTYQALVYKDLFGKKPMTTTAKAQ